MRVNLVPHLCWLVAILLAVIAFLVLRVTNGAEVNSYISFASSIASLILAVVAIFYSIVSNDSISNNLSSLQGLREEIQSQAASLDEAAEKFVAKIEDFTPKLSMLPSQMDAIGQGIEERLQAFSSRGGTSTATTGGSETNDDGSYFERKVTAGVSLAAYIIALASKYNKTVVVADMFEPGSITGSYVNASVATLEATCFKGINLAFINGTFYVNDPGKMNVDRVIEIGESKTEEFWTEARAKVKKYFGLLPAQDSSESLSVPNT